MIPLRDLSDLRRGRGGRYVDADIRTWLLDFLAKSTVIRSLLL
jgi:hypothetical protein